ncbi:MAG: hypothetical protein HY898_16470 [Deltaproteobacteria bacterium]|nr:hypothetical protein [Deltaproteobacteria bacterium]
MALRFDGGAVLSLLLLACVGSASCSSSDPTSADAGGAFAGSSGSSASLEAGWPCNTSGNLDLSGLWAVQLDLTLILANQAGGTVTLCPGNQINTATILLLVQATQPPGALTLDQVRPVFCAFELPSLTAVLGQCEPDATNTLTMSLLLGAALQQKLAAVPTESVQGGLSAASAGAGVGLDRFRLTAGTRKQGTAMPSWQSDVPGCGFNDTSAGRSSQCEPKCVDDCGSMVDDDEDGRAGVSFEVCGYTSDDMKSDVKCRADQPDEPGIAIQGPLLLNFQVDPRLTGTALSSCEVRGDVDAQVVYQVVGGDLYVMNSQLSVMSSLKSLPLFTVDATKSRFRMVRVDGAQGAPDWKLDLADPIAACSAAVGRRNELR